jgi:hypothetical protein
MLNCFFFTKNLFNFFQSGLYIDFIIKKFSEIFVKEVLVSTCTFFCEKYLIEFFTKKILDNFIYLSIFFRPSTYFFESFFAQVIFILFYFIFFLEFLYFF